eukprot:jgi/Botrbrau1/97/Bobra.0022s0087.1
MGGLAEQFTVIKLYRDCLRLADYIGARGGDRWALRRHVGSEFRKNAGETDPAKISDCKDAAVRGLANYMFHEAQRMVKDGKA